VLSGPVGWRHRSAAMICESDLRATAASGDREKTPGWETNVMMILVEVEWRIGETHLTQNRSISVSSPTPLEVSDETFETGS